MSISKKGKCMQQVGEWVFFLIRKDNGQRMSVLKKKETQQAANFNFRNKGNITVIECRFLEKELQQSVNVDF